MRRVVWSLLRFILLRGVRWLLDAYVVYLLTLVVVLALSVQRTLAARGITRKKVAYTGAALILGVSAVVAGQAYRVGGAGNTYYVAPTGSDAATGRAPDAPWRSIARCALSLAPGDTCSIATGTYHEMVIPQESGTDTHPITYTAQPGALVTVDGADTLGGWVPTTQAGVYTTSASLPVDAPQDAGFFANQLFADGVMIPEAEYPRNTGTLFSRTSGTVDSVAAVTGGHRITDTLLTQPAGSLVGATLHVQGGSGWTWNTGTVTGNDPTTRAITVTGAWTNDATLDPKVGSPYYLSGPPNTALLQYPGSWAYTPLTHTIFLWLPDSSDPNGHNVEAKGRTLAFDLSGKSHIAIAGLAVFGATVATDAASSWDTLTGITATYVSHFQTLPPNPLRHDYPYWAHAYDTGIIISGTHETLANSVIQWSAGNGVSLQGSDNVVTDTLIRYTDYSGGYDSFIRPRLDGARLTIAHNTMDTTGRGGIEFTVATTPTVPGASATGDSVSYNDIGNVMKLTNDGGTIYAADITGTNSVIDHNWVHDLDASSSSVTGGGTGNGIYLDNGSNSFTVHHNVGWNLRQACVEINNVSQFPLVTDSFPLPHDNLVANNTCPSGETYGVRYNAIGSATQSAPNNRVVNNILGTGANVFFPDVAQSYNLFTNPAYVDSAHHNYALPPGSQAINAGTPVGGITPAGDTAPDQGAYESMGPVWVPGCRLGPICYDPQTPGLHPTP